jgi:hypothetical protein
MSPGKAPTKAFRFPGRLARIAMAAAVLFLPPLLCAQKSMRPVPADTIGKPAWVRRDTGGAGVVVVRRPPVPASYYSRQVYSYRSVHLKGNRRNPETGYRNPEPVMIIGHDSMQFFSDSLLPDELIRRNDRPKAQFDFTRCMDACGHTFRWEDSVRIDSARFEFIISKKGRAKCRMLAWETADSSTRAFEAKAFAVMNRLSRWYPARRWKGDGMGRAIRSSVIVTVYAYRNNRPDRIQ